MGNGPTEADPLPGAGDGSRIGGRLRELRLSHRMTQRELAEAAGVSIGLLSQLENNVTEPSLSTLRRLASVFKAEVASLFREPDPPLIFVSRPGERMLLRAPSGELTYERITPGRGELEVLRGVMAPGDVSGKDRHGHESTECIVVAAGEVTVELAGEEICLVAGEAMTFDARIPHRYVNRTDGETVILLSITPPLP